MPLERSNTDPARWSKVRSQSPVPTAEYDTQSPPMTRMENSPKARDSEGTSSLTMLQRAQWQRANSHPAGQMPQARPQLPPMPVAESTKRKLDAFRAPRRPGMSTPAEVNNNNSSNSRTTPLTTTAASTTTTTTTTPAHGSTKIPSTDEQQPSMTNHDRWDEPGSATTLLGRLAWGDIMGNQGEREQEEEKARFAADRIGWDHRAVLRTPLVARKGRKRARSSSPTMSPISTKKTPATPAAGVATNGLDYALKTPHADPILDLWDKFAVGRGENASPSRATNPLLARCMVSSSPRMPLESGRPPRERPLRKSLSHGSNVKRRKIERPGLDSFRSISGSPQPNSKLSMVSALLETVDGEIQKSAALADVGSQLSPSPSPNKRVSQRRRRPESQGKENQPPTTPRDARHDQAPSQKSLGVDKSSDYGDDFDFDEDTLMEFDASVQTQQDSAELPYVAATAEPDISACEDQAPPTKPGTESDEFDDLDDDFFDGAEHLIAEVETAFPTQLSLQAAPEQRQPEAAVAPQTHQDALEHEDDKYGDDFGGDFDFEAAELAATQSAATTTRRISTSVPHPSPKPRVIQRYLVTTVLDSSYVDESSSRELPEKILVVQADGTNSIKTIHLRGDWVDTPASNKAFVHVIGEFEPSGMCIIDNNRNILILHPDQLISSTVIADSFSCMRRAVLQDRVKATSDPTPPLVYGTILHELFQEALLANKWDTVFLASLITKTLDKHLEDLYMIKVGLDEARDHLLSKMAELRSWSQAFVTAQPRPDAIVQGRNGDTAQMCVTKLLDVEEHVWSPMYGMKGNIDATVQVTMQEMGPTRQTRTLTVPFEVKTGKRPTPNHQAQTALYNLLLSDRYDIEIQYGVLYYMETSQILRIPTVRHELRHMIMQRNELACYVRERSVQLPPMKRSKNACGNCYAQSSCFTYHKLADGGDGETSGVGAKFDDVVQHLSETHKHFFLQWEDLLTKEEKESQRLRRELWTMVSSEREKVGRCFGDLVIEPGSAVEDVHQPKINRFTYTFNREKPAPGFSFLESQLIVGEPIVVSDEQGHFALALGFVTAVKKHRISVAVDRRLHNARIRQPGFDQVDNQVFAGIMDVSGDRAEFEQSQSRSQGVNQEKSIRYRLDKDEFSNGMATVRNNLVRVMADGPRGGRRIRELVVDLAPPKFKTVATQYVIADQGSLNVDQRQAVEKVMSARDYALVLGMPGTGKTTTIAHIIRALVAQGKSVLLTSYTHTAVDNILLKLKTDRIPVLRLGAPAKVHPDVRDFVTLAAEPKKSFDEIKAAWHDTPVVATTCLGINHPLFHERTFDYCIVDEASQITLPICLGPIRMARTFVLVGDHNQLPPLVQNEEARAGGLDVSLFKLLSDTHPESVVNLEHQYRMCEDIMTLSNTLIYEGRLKCGTEALRSSSLRIPHMDRLQLRHFDPATFVSSPRAATNICPGPAPTQCWLRELLDPEVRVRFVSTDAIPGSREEAKGNRIVNACEATIVAQLVDALLTVGVPASEIGVMTHYRSQLALLRHSLLGLARGTAPPPFSRAGAAADASGIEMHTADRFQGRDKDVVVLSLVRSNDACTIGDLLKDWRRINVAFTRAKTKLLVVGSRATLKGSGQDEMLARFIGLMEARDWVYDLPADALRTHHFDDAALPPTPAAMDKVLDGASSPRAGLAPRLPKRELSPKNTLAHGGRSGQPPRGKENARPEPKRAKMGERAVLKGRPILRDILNDMAGGTY